MAAMELQESNHTLEDQVLEVPGPVSMPFILSFHNLSYSVKLRRKIFPASCFRRRANNPTVPELGESGTKVLLDNISGEAKEGEILAVLGASGSGKSTLIDALANRISRESLVGGITLNGDVLTSSLLKAISAYVMQDDLLFPMLTVEETLMFSAEFRLPAAMSRSRKKARVGALIDQLGLRDAAATVIGDEGHRGVSGGERRRVSIGIDIIHDPILLFLDEPTSGLDSTSAYMVVKVLRRIAQTGSIVVMSIHQPSYRILTQLDRLLILSGGRTVFNHSPHLLPQFFADFGRPIPSDDDTTEFAMDLIRDLESTSGGTQSLVDFNRTWLQPEQIRNPSPKLSLKSAITASISAGKLVSGSHMSIINDDSNLSSSSSSSSVQKYANPIWREILVLWKRTTLNSRRTPEQLGVRLGAVLVTGVLLATIFWQLDDSPKGVQERLGFFAFAMSTAFYTCAEAIPVFLLQRDIFLRETSYNAYRLSSYVLSHSMTSLPSLLLLALTFSATTFWAVGLSSGTSGGFVFYLSFVFASFWAGNSYVTFLSGVIYNVMVAYTVVVASLAYFVLFSGLFIGRDRIPAYWMWLHYGSLVKYPYEGVMQNEFGDASRCFVRGTEVFDVTPLKDVAEATKVKLLETMGEVVGMEMTGRTCLTTGVDVLKQAGVMDVSKWNCLWITVGLGFLFRVLFYFALLLFGSRSSKRR
ncbi:ABC transporter G family member 6-like [Andrographis paniculata]|uniref:ABC transporter G family member 6-like n=1 Tax=Andrographis paniculata TaxID=175694 RepID=UPI0021E6EBA2|nr:ABC transporter G family member 6-like [Andrographis paniculata]